MVHLQCVLFSVIIAENEDTQKYAFTPAMLSIKVGAEVIWTNDSDAPHTVTSDTGAFNTPKGFPGSLAG